MNGSPLSASRSNSSFEKGFHRPSENTEEIRSFFLFLFLFCFCFGSSGEMRRGNNASDLLLKKPLIVFIFLSSTSEILQVSRISKLPLNS